VFGVVHVNDDVVHDLFLSSRGEWRGTGKH